MDGFIHSGFSVSLRTLQGIYLVNFEVIRLDAKVFEKLQQNIGLVFFVKRVRREHISTRTMGTREGGLSNPRIPLKSIFEGWEG